MNGYLRHLIQRSLTAVPDVRPRPVSRFETGQPSAAADSPPAELFDLEQRLTDSQDTRADRRSGPVMDADSRRTAPAEGATSPDPGLNLPGLNPPALNSRDDALHRPPPSPPNAVSRHDSTRTAVVAETHEHDVFAQSVAPAGAELSGEDALRSSVAEPDQRHGQTRSILKRHANPEVPRGLLDETSIHAVTESDPLDSDGLGARRFRVQGKLAAQPDSSDAGTRPQLSTAARDDFSAPADPVQIAPSQSQDRAAVAQPDVRAVASPVDPLRSLSRDKPSAAAHAILAPRLPLPEPVAQPAQPSMSKMSEPVVHVTIGRVEIRAVSAPAAQKRSAPPKPALSLSDYLQRRSGGQG